MFLSRHLIVALHWIHSLIKRWWPELSANGKSVQQGCPCDGYVHVVHCLIHCFVLFFSYLTLSNQKSILFLRHSNIQVMKQQLQELWVDGSRLILVPGTTGEMAKVKCKLENVKSTPVDIDLKSFKEEIQWEPINGPVAENCQ